MAVEHKDLTGAMLHEPKGTSTASSGQVYIANGSGSGVWTSKNGDLLNANIYSQRGTMTDIGLAGDSVFFDTPQKAQVKSVSCVLYGAIATSNAILSIYINGVLNATTLSVPFSGSTAGTRATINVAGSPTALQGQVIEVRTDGGPSNTVKAAITLTFANIV